MANTVSGTVSGIVEKIHKNDNGFFGIKVADEWFGAGKYAPKFNKIESNIKMQS